MTRLMSAWDVLARTDDQAGALAECPPVIAADRDDWFWRAGLTSALRAKGGTDRAIEQY